MAKMSHVERTLAWLEEHRDFEHIGRVEAFRGLAGRKCLKCGTFLRPQGKKTDLWGIFDYMAIDISQSYRIWGIQVCGGDGDFGRHRDKLLASDAFQHFQMAGGNVMLIGWRKLKLKRGGKAERWRPWIFEWGIGHYFEDQGNQRDADGKLV